MRKLVRARRSLRPRWVCAPAAAPLRSLRSPRRVVVTALTRRSSLAMAAVALAVSLGACSGTTTGAQSINATSATLTAAVGCQAGETCDAYFQWRVDGTSSWVKGPDLGPVTGPVSLPLTYTATVYPGTLYDYQICGRAAGSSVYPQYVCAGPQGAGSYSTFSSLPFEPQPAVTAQQFADSIGINYHYRNASNPATNAQAISDMRWLGVTHVRMDAIHSANSGFNSYVWGNWTAIRQAGFKMSVMIPQGCSDYYSQWAPGAVAD